MTLKRRQDDRRLRSPGLERFVQVEKQNEPRFWLRFRDAELHSMCRAGTALREMARIFWRLQDDVQGRRCISFAVCSAWNDQFTSPHHTPSSIIFGSPCSSLPLCSTSSLSVLRLGSRSRSDDLHDTDRIAFARWTREVVEIRRPFQKSAITANPGDVASSTVAVTDRLTWCSRHSPKSTTARFYGMAIMVGLARKSSGRSS